MDQDDRIVAVGLLTRRDLSLLGPTFDRLWPVEEAPEFEELLEAIDEADEKLRLEMPPAQGGQTEMVEAVSGACMILPRAAFERVGGFDEGYFLVFPD